MLSWNMDGHHKTYVCMNNLIKKYKLVHSSTVSYSTKTIVIVVTHFVVNLAMT